MSVDAFSKQVLFVCLGSAFCLQCIDGVAHGLGRDMDQSPETLLQFEFPEPDRFQAHIDATTGRAEEFALRGRSPRLLAH
jgi:hypothetical protein